MCGELAPAAVEPNRHGRFIPACAGNSAARPVTAARTPVHPRVCGELRVALWKASQIGGSSPRVRGTLSRSSASCCGATVHPRVCGELVGTPRHRPMLSGSSPRVRGTRQPGAGLVRLRRFIPACAGNSYRQQHCGCDKPVHPRVCGELPRAPWRGASLVGSSPRVRGTPRAANSRRAAPAVHPRVCGELAALASPAPRHERFIPACAGNSHVLHVVARPAHGSSPRVRGTRIIPWMISLSAPVHPRVCGELAAERSATGSTAGSSPRVRGTLPFSKRGCEPARFIPACAGNSSSGLTRKPMDTVHPRVCGELQRAAATTRRSGRFIPACAGNSAC